MIYVFKESLRGNYCFARVDYDERMTDEIASYLAYVPPPGDRGLFFKKFLAAEFFLQQLVVIIGFLK